MSTLDVNGSTQNNTTGIVYLDLNIPQAIYETWISQVRTVELRRIE